MCVVIVFTKSGCSRRTISRKRENTSARIVVNGERAAVGKRDAAAVVPEPDEFFVGGGVVVEDRVPEWTDGTCGSENHVGKDEFVRACGLRTAGDGGLGAPSGVSVSCRDFSQVRFDGVGRYGSGVAKHHLEGVAAKIVNLLSARLNEGIELGKCCHGGLLPRFGCCVLL